MVTIKPHSVFVHRSLSPAAFLLLRCEKWVCICGLLLSSALGRLSAIPPDGYYATAEDKMGIELRSALHHIATNGIWHNSPLFVGEYVASVSLSDQCQYSVICIYGGESRSRNYGDLFGWRNDCRLPSKWVIEPIWPMDYGPGNQQIGWARVDLHALRPCDRAVSNARRNKFYDFSDPGDPTYVVPANSSAPRCSMDGDSWEPPDDEKGDIARALFYMDVFYAGQWQDPDLRLVEDVKLIKSGRPFMGKLSTLLKWHSLDTVDTLEKQRNDRVHKIQKNRNPFVDRPEWVTAVFMPTLKIRRRAQLVELLWSSDLPVVIEKKETVDGQWGPVSSPPSTNEVLVVLIPEEEVSFFRAVLK